MRPRPREDRFALKASSSPRPELRLAACTRRFFTHASKIASGTGFGTALLLLATLAPVGQGAAASDAVQGTDTQPGTPGQVLLDAFARKFGALETFEAAFTQSQEWVGADASPEWRGTLYLKRPNLFRVEYDEPKGHLQVSDGKTVWTYVPENGEVLSAKLDSTAGAGGDVLRWILETGTAEPEVTETEVKGKSVLELSLLPQAGLGLSRVRIWISPKTLELVRYEITDSSGNRNLYTLGETRKNPKLSNELFRFVPPDGVPVVQLGAP